MYHTDIKLVHFNSSKKSCMTGRASEKSERPTNTADKKDEEESLHVACQSTCEGHDKSNSRVSSKSAGIGKEDKSELEST
jgi:hypothetical protein